MALSQEVRPPSENYRPRSRWDVIVVGCGIMGAAASYNIATKGLRVLNIERFGVNHEHGSSHGRTRIFRTAYYEDPRYVPLLRRALEAWKEVELKSGKTLLKMTGGLMIGRPDGELVAGTLKAARIHGIPYELMTASEAEGRFGAFRLEEGLAAVHEQGAGVLLAEECVRAFVGLGSEAGCEYRFSEEVRGWKPRTQGVEVETQFGTQSADRLVFCAGAWSGPLLKGVVPLQVERQVPLWFSSGGEEKFTPQEMPVFVADEGDGVFYYGIPDLGHGVKVARHHGGKVGEPDEVTREATEEDIAPVRSFASRRLKGLHGPPISTTTCLYTNTPDFNFAVGPHPDDDRVSVVSGGSGHGFKFASVLGEVVSSLVSGEKLDYDISFLSPARFGQKGPG